MQNKIISISFAKVDFSCPYCGKKYDDEDDKYYNRCIKNKHFAAKIKCECGEIFGFTYDITGQAVGYKMKKDTVKAIEKFRNL